MLVTARCRVFLCGLRCDYRFMSTCRLIIYEKSSHWAAAVRVSLAGRPPDLVEVRSLSQVERALEGSPASVVGFDVSSAKIEAVLDFLERGTRQFPRARFVAFIPGDFASLLLREAGAIDVLTTVLQSDRLAQLARRQFALGPASEPMTMGELVAELLPWPAYATTSANHSHAR